MNFLFRQKKVVFTLGICLSFFKSLTFVYTVSPKRSKASLNAKLNGAISIPLTAPTTPACATYTGPISSFRDRLSLNFCNLLSMTSVDIHLYKTDFGNCLLCEDSVPTCPFNKHILFQVNIIILKIRFYSL